MNKKQIIAKVISRLEGYSSKWLAPDNKVYHASKAGHQDWIDENEEFLVDKEGCTITLWLIIDNSLLF